MQIIYSEDLLSSFQFQTYSNRLKSFLIKFHKYLDQQWIYDEVEKTLTNRNGDWMLHAKKWSLPKEGETGYIMDESSKNVLGLQPPEDSKDKSLRNRTVVALEDPLAG